MTRDDIIRWALEAGFPRIGDKPIISCGRDELEHFAAIVAAHERTACAEICDSKVAAEYATGKVDHNEIGWTQACAAAIRARGTT